MRIAIIANRFGFGAVTKSESTAKLYALEASQRLKWEVDFFASNSKDDETWTSCLMPGVDLFAPGIRVHRFACSSLRDERLYRWFMRCFSWFIKSRNQTEKKTGPGFLENLWLKLLGPQCPQLVDHVLRSQDLFDAILLFGFQSYLTLLTLKSFRGRKIFFPLLREGSAAHFFHTKSALACADVVAVSSEEELALLRRLYPVIAQKARILPPGFDIQQFSIDENSSSLSDLPETFVLYIGRVGRTKHVDRLIRHFEGFKREKIENDIHLVIVGPMETGFIVPDAPFFHYMGYVSESDKALLIRRALCLINCSPFESLPLTTIEALGLGVPILINELSETLRYYMKRVPTVFGYRNGADFIKQLTEIAAINWQEDPVRRAQIEQSQDWIKSTFSWPSTLQQLGELIVDKNIGS